VSLLFQLIVFLQPSWKELLVFFVVDCAMAAVGFQLTTKMFSWCYPCSKPFFPVLDPRIYSIGEEQKRQTFQAILEYPKQIALFIIPANFIKVIPATLVILFYWQHGLPIMTAYAYVVIIMFFNFSYMSGMAYLENHHYLSNVIASIHKDQDWSEVFGRSQFNGYRQGHLFGGKSIRNPMIKAMVELCSLENFFIFAIWVFASALLVALIHDGTQTATVKSLSSVCIALFACMFTMRIIHASRKEIQQGLESVLDFYNPDRNQPQKYLPLHTSPLVRFYQESFNTLIRKIHEHEKEISSWIMDRAEQKRFDSLGEIAGLVVHDLINPVHSVKYCVTSIKEKNIPEIKRYVDQASDSIDFTTEILVNLKNNIRNPNEKAHLSFLKSAAYSTSKTIKYYFEPGEAQKVQFNIDIPAEVDGVLMPQTELNQVLTNLVSNSFKNLIKHEIVDPSVHLTLGRETREHFVLQVRDNGTGLDPQAFEFFNDEQSRPQINPASSGIGLKLTKRLVELYGGTLSVLPPSSQKPGTTFELQLKKATEDHYLN